MRYCNKKGDTVIKLDVWRDKLPEDKVKYYNRTRMSLEFFAQKLNTVPQNIIEDLKCHGYVYNEQRAVCWLSLL